MDDVVKDADTCAASIKVNNICLSYIKHITLKVFSVFIYAYFVFLQDYELQLASYSAGLETLLNIPIKRTMLQSPATELRQEVMADLTSHFITF